MSTMPFLIDLNNKANTGGLTNQIELNNNQIMVAYTTHILAQSGNTSKVNSGDLYPKYITGWLNQPDITFSTANDWKVLYDVMMAGSWDIINKFLAGGFQASLVFDSMMQKLWMNSNITPLTISLKFIAHSDPIKEVWNPVFDLLAMAHPIDVFEFSSTSMTDIGKKILPNTTGIIDTMKDGIVNLLGTLCDVVGKPLLLGSPNTSLVNIGNGEMPYFLYLKIGNMLTLQDCILTDVSIDLPTGNLYSDGTNTTPLSADVTLTIMPQLIWTKDTINELMTNRSTLAMQVPSGGMTKLLASL